MKIRICILIIIWGILYPEYLNSQESPYVFRQIGVVEGLPDNYVKSVFPIPDGRIGVRSTVLLSLYDGANYSNFPFNIHGEYPIVYNHIIPEQYIDTDKRLWMKERKSLRVFDLTTEQYIYNVDSLFLQFGLKDRVEDLIIDSEKRYWFLTPGSSVYTYDTETKSAELVCRNDEFMEYYVKSVVPIIESNYDKFTPVEKQIANFFIHNSEKMDFSIKHISELLFTSKATLVRFAQKCGYHGYKEFIYQYEETLIEKPEKITDNTRMVLNAYQELLNKAYSLSLIHI